MSAPNLPRYPTKGRRRALDRDWLSLLHKEGASAYLDASPEPPAALGGALREFNRGEYWRCHETLEQLWLDEGYPLRLYYHALLKAAVGMLHLTRHNRRGALSKLRDAESGMIPFLPNFMGVDTEELQLQVVERLSYLEAGDRVDWSALDGLPSARIHSS